MYTFVLSIPGFASLKHAVACLAVFAPFIQHTQNTQRGFVTYIYITFVLALRHLSMLSYGLQPPLPALNGNSAQSA